MITTRRNHRSLLIAGAMMLRAPLAVLPAERNLPGVPRFGKLRAGSFQALETPGAMASKVRN